MTLRNYINRIKNSSIERFGIIYHNDKGVVGLGSSLTGTETAIHGIQPQDILDEASLLGATSMTLMHNHPKAENPRPSENDLHTTFTIHDHCKKHGIRVLDHIIFGSGKNTFSFIKNGIEI